jgi:hypothetical protein
MSQPPNSPNNKTSNADVPILNTVDHFENTEKKYLSMTPTSMKKHPQQPSGKKHSFVTASKAINEEPLKNGHHKVNSFKIEPKLE